MVSSNTRIDALEEQIARLEAELEKERHRDCPNCGSENYILHTAAGLPDVRRCFDCRYPNHRWDATGYVFGTHKQLLASLPKADKYDITITSPQVIPTESNLEPGVMMTTQSVVLKGKERENGWDVWWEGDNPPLIG